MMASDAAPQGKKVAALDTAPEKCISVRGRAERLIHFCRHREPAPARAVPILQLQYAAGRIVARAAKQLRRDFMPVHAVVPVLAIAHVAAVQKSGVPPGGSPVQEMKTNDLLFCLRGSYRPPALKPEPAPARSLQQFIERGQLAGDARGQGDALAAAPFALCRHHINSPGQFHRVEGVLQPEQVILPLLVAVADAPQVVKLAGQVGTQSLFPSFFQQPANVAGERPRKAALLFSGGQPASQKQVILREGGRDPVAVGSVQRNQPAPRQVMTFRLSLSIIGVLHAEPH